MEQRFLRRTKSIAGIILVGIGAIIFTWNLNQAATEVSRLVVIIPRQTLGILPAIIVAASRAAQVCAAGNPHCLPMLLHALATTWPLLLVASGAFLSKDSSSH